MVYAQKQISFFISTGALLLFRIKQAYNTWFLLFTYGETTFLGSTNAFLLICVILKKML